MRTLETLRYMEGAASALRTNPALALSAWRTQTLIEVMRATHLGPPADVLTLRLRPFLSAAALSRAAGVRFAETLPAWRGMLPTSVQVEGRVPWVQGWVFLGPEMEGFLRRGQVPFQWAGRETQPFPEEPLLFRDPLTEESLLQWLSREWRARWWQDLRNPFMVAQEYPDRRAGAFPESGPALFQDTTEEGSLVEVSETPSLALPGGFRLDSDSES